MRHRLTAAFLVYVMGNFSAGYGYATEVSHNAIKGSNGRCEGTLERVYQSAIIARQNNVRVVSPVRWPPTVTISTAAPSELTNSYSWSGSTSNTINYYGGTPITDAVGCRNFSEMTAKGPRRSSEWRAEALIDAKEFSFGVFSFAKTSQYRVTVDGHYVNPRPMIAGHSGLNSITVDFTSAGGRVVRDVVLEGQIADFCGINVSPGETVAKPHVDAIRAFLTGDSFAAGQGSKYRMDAFPGVLGDLLGIRDMWWGGIVATGYVTDPFGFGNAVQRISEIAHANPDIIISTNGHNDVGRYDQLKAQVLLFLRTIRSYPNLAKVPVFVTGILNGRLGTGPRVRDAERSIADAVRQFGDGLVFFIPSVLDPRGPWMKGNGDVTAPNGSGNADRYISSDRVHPNSAGHFFLAQKIAEGILHTLRQKCGAH